MVPSCLSQENNTVKEPDLLVSNIGDVLWTNQSLSGVVGFLNRTAKINDHKIVFKIIESDPLYKNETNFDLIKEDCTYQDILQRITHILGCQYIYSQTNDARTIHFVQSIQEPFEVRFYQLKRPITTNGELYLKKIIKKHGILSDPKLVKKYNRLIIEATASQHKIIEWVTSHVTTTFRFNGKTYVINFNESLTVKKDNITYQVSYFYDGFVPLLSIKSDSRSFNVYSWDVGELKLTP